MIILTFDEMLIEFGHDSRLIEIYIIITRNDFLVSLQYIIMLCFLFLCRSFYSYSIQKAKYILM